MFVFWELSTWVRPRPALLSGLDPPLRLALCLLLRHAAPSPDRGTLCVAIGRFHRRRMRDDSRQGLRLSLVPTVSLWL